MKCYSVTKRSEHDAHNDMDGSKILMLNERSQSEKVIQYMSQFIYNS